MESNSGPEIVGFGFLRRRLLETVSSRIGNGEFTERGFARFIGISQPQAHNILKGARNLSAETADLILAKLGISILDLLESSERPLPMPPRDPAPVMAIAHAAAVGAFSSVMKKPPATEMRPGGRLVRQMGS
ncbi:MAG TPA: helix-turn-helix transcriptional regulator [Bryobacteraceae bacterium]|jgi:transcriptional regulator with XRE-family HTH domain|nr:helix-turn-helix transcriptional regulator [Bryobacteraceae bacterium]